MPFHLLSFEGPDDYARAGGIATRVTGLAQALAEAGYETHLWFVGDPDLPGHERHDHLQLHRWCQWISRYHPAGVYAGEEGKRLEDLNTPDEAALQAHVTLVKHQEWRRSRYEARVTLTLAERILEAMHLAKTPYEAMVTALKAVERKLRALRALEGAAAVPIIPTWRRSPSHEHRPSFSHEGDTDEGAGPPIRHRWTG